MKKAIRLTVSLRIEGEAEPALNWAEFTTRAVQDILAAGQASHPGLTVTVRKIVEDRNYDEDEEGTTGKVR